MKDQLEVIITLQPHKQAGASLDNLHSYKILVDDVEIESKSMSENKFTESFLVNLNLSLEPGEHTIKVNYRNTENKGVLQIQNIYVAGEHGGVNLDSLVKRYGTVVYGNRTEANKAAVWWNGTYCFRFNSPFFYWALSKFPI